MQFMLIFFMDCKTASTKVDSLVHGGDFISTFPPTLCRFSCSLFVGEKKTQLEVLLGIPREECVEGHQKRHKANTTEVRGHAV